MCGDSFVGRQMRSLKVPKKGIQIENLKMLNLRQESCSPASCGSGPASVRGGFLAWQLETVAS